MSSLYTLLILLLFTGICRAGEQWESDYPILSGRYDMVGRQWESGKLYAGTITIDEVKPNQFVVTRLIEGKRITGSGRVEFATGDKIPILRIHFVENGIDMEGTYLWSGDLDNEGRISGYIYKEGYQGENPGLEALFASKK